MKSSASCTTAGSCRQNYNHDPPPTPTQPPRLHGDTPLFQCRYTEISGEDPEENRVAYLSWLQDAGVDPVSGKMTEAGLNLYKQLLERGKVKRSQTPEKMRGAT